MLVARSHGTLSWNNRAGVHCEVVHIQQMLDNRMSDDRWIDDMRRTVHAFTGLDFNASPAYIV